MEKLATYRETGVWPVAKADLAPHKKKEAWSENKEQKFKKKEKKQLKLETKNKKKKRKIDQDEWDELARDTHLMKKLKKKKVLHRILIYLMTIKVLQAQIRKLFFSGFR